MSKAPMQFGGGRRRPESIRNDLNRELISWGAVGSRGQTTTQALPNSGAVRLAVRLDFPLPGNLNRIRMTDLGCVLRTHARYPGSLR
jgi:hypothetical protein